MKAKTLALCGVIKFVFWCGFCERRLKKQFNEGVKYILDSAVLVHAKILASQIVQIAFEYQISFHK